MAQKKVYDKEFKIQAVKLGNLCLILVVSYVYSS